MLTESFPCEWLGFGDYSERQRFGSCSSRFASTGAGPSTQREFAPDRTSSQRLQCCCSVSFGRRSLAERPPPVAFVSVACPPGPRHPSSPSAPFLPSSSAAFVVAVLSASSGVIPAFTNQASSRVFSPNIV